jgi:hypothetical protein
MDGLCDLVEVKLPCDFYLSTVQKL